jgi:hypothetical protein
MAKKEADHTAFHNSFTQKFHPHNQILNSR